MPNSCTVLKGLTFLLCLVTALDLHCLPSVHLSPLLLCLLYQVFQNPHSVAPALEQLMGLPDASCALLCRSGVSSPLFRDWSDRLGYAWSMHFPWAVHVNFPKSLCSGSHQILLFKWFSTNTWWQVWEPLVSLLSTAQCVHWYLTELLLYFKSVWINLPSLCLEFIEHQRFYVSCVRTGLLLRSFESLILWTTLTP